MLLPLLFFSFSCTCLGRTVNNPNAKCQFLLWYKLSSYISLGSQIELLVLSSLTTFPSCSLLLVGCKKRLHFYRRWRMGFYPSCHSRGFILHLDLPSRQKTPKGGTCSCSLGLPPSISHSRLCKLLFVVYSLTSFHCHSLAQS